MIKCSHVSDYKKAKVDFGDSTKKIPILGFKDLILV